eukprot:gene28676-32389_t
MVATIFPLVNGELPLNLGLAESYAVIASSTVTSTGTVGTVVTGDLGVYPGTVITGFPPAFLNGTLNIANQAANDARGDLLTAYNVLAAKTYNSVLSGQDLGGMTLLPGVYSFATGATITGVLTLDAAKPTVAPTLSPSRIPSNQPSTAPSAIPTTEEPSITPSATPSADPTAVPSQQPSVAPSADPS